MKPTVLTFSQNSNGLFSQRFKSGENSLVGFCKILLSLTKNILHNIYVIYITNIINRKTIPESLCLFRKNTKVALFTKINCHFISESHLKK